MTFAEMCATLVKEPYFLSLDQIADLTDFQLTQIYFRPSWEEQRRRRLGHLPVLTPQGLFEKVWAARGLTADQIKEKWQRDYPDKPWD